MVASLQSPADIVNAALTRIGYHDRVGSLYEGSKAAKKSLDIYSQTRDEMLRTGNWPFSRRDVLATLIKAAPVGGYTPLTPWSSTYPPPPWAFEYGYPSDCIKVGAVKPPPVFTPNFTPQPFIFAVANDGNQRVILSDVPNATITYTGQITDPTQMPPDFVEAFMASLARRLLPILGDPKMLQAEAQDEVVETAIADRQQG
jgi:hypothetical protein